MRDRISGWPLGRLGVGLSLVIAAALLGVFAHSSLSSTFRGDRAEAATVTVRIGDFWFCDSAGPQPCSQPHDTQVSAGDTVVWEWGAGGSGTSFSHTTTNCADNFTTCSGPREWDSSPSKTTGTFSHTFGSEDAGKTFLYRCQIHPTTMQGRIIVQAIATPTPTNTPTPTTPTPTPTTPTPTLTPPTSTPTTLTPTTPTPIPTTPAPTPGPGL
ncbi:MAG: hypothetical protein V3S20_09475, partial [Dehalococcoidia bacterium]